jgi:hypothetical protein
LHDMRGGSLPAEFGVKFEATRLHFVR